MPIHQNLNVRQRWGDFAEAFVQCRQSAHALAWKHTCPASLLRAQHCHWRAALASRLSVSLQFASTSNGVPRMRSGSSLAVRQVIHCSSVFHHESFPQHQRLSSAQIHQTEQEQKLQIKLDYNSRENSRTGQTNTVLSKQTNRRYRIACLVSSWNASGNNQGFKLYLILSTKVMHI